MQIITACQRINISSNVYAVHLFDIWLSASINYNYYFNDIIFYSRAVLFIAIIVSLYYNKLDYAAKDICCKKVKLE